MTEKLRSLIRKGRDLDRQHKQLGDELKQTKTEIIQGLGAGKHEGTGKAVATVILPAASLQPVENLDGAQEILGEHHPFTSMLFRAETVYRPAKGFREIARAILPAEIAERLIAAFESPSAPQCRFS